MTAEEIKSLRLSLHLSQVKFAKLLNVTKVTVWKWETKRSIPYDFNLHSLVELKNKGEN